MRRTTRQLVEKREAKVLPSEEANRSLKHQLGLCRAILEYSADATLSFGPALQITAWDAGAEQIFGYTMAEAVGQSADMLIPEHKQASTAEMLRKVDREGYVCNWRAQCCTKDERLIDIEATVGNLGSDVGYTVFLRDITDRLSIERETERQQADKMEAMGRLARAVAHEFSNLLTVILGYAQLAIVELTSQSPMERYLHGINDAGERAASLTRQLLAFGREQAFQSQELDLNESIVDLARKLDRQVGKDIMRQTTLDPELGKIQADPAQIEQLIMNLAVNARDAMPQGGTLTIETANVSIDQVYAESHVGAQIGPHVMLTVSDTGIGLDPETQSYIFEPFYTTKDEQGSGFGLSTVYGIIRQSNGRICVHSVPGQGTTFRIYFPQVDFKGNTTQAESPVGTSLDPETILLVEEESVVRNLAYRILSQNGYRVLVASNPEEAASICRQHQDQIHLLLTDLGISQIGGRGLPERLRLLQPEMKVLYMSGYTGDVVDQHGMLDGTGSLLEKPFAAHVLLLKVREHLDT